VTAGPGIETAGCSPRRVLIIEDDELQRSVLEAVLASAGFEVTVSDGNSAVSRIRDGGYDVVLLDYLLPDTSGLAIASLIREKMDDADRPGLLALTALADIVAGQETMSGKVFDAILQKSSDMAGLVAAVRKHARTSAGRNSNAIGWVS
jgi:DNA-binding response OmpR family regulator